MDPGTTSDDDVPPADGVIGDARLPQVARWGFWATVIWALVIAAVSVVVQIGTVLAVADWSLADPADRNFERLIFSGMSKGYSFSLANLLSAIVGCGLIAAIVRLKKHAVVREYLGLKPVAVRAMLKWTGFFVVLIAATDLTLEWFDEATGKEYMSTIYKDAKPVWMLWPAVVIAAPLFEEIFFRGFLLTGFAASFMRPIGAVVVTAGLWAAIHIQYGAVGIAIVFCLGLLFGTARIRTGSLMVPLTLHSLENLLAMAAAAIPD